MRVALHVDEKMTQQAIDLPGRRSVSQLIDLRKSDLQFIETVETRLVNPGMLAGGTDEQSAEEIREAGVVLPIGEQRPQEVGATEEGAVGGRRRPHDDVVATTGADMPTVKRKLLGSQPTLPGILVEARRV